MLLLHFIASAITETRHRLPVVISIKRQVQIIVASCTILGLCPLLYFSNYSILHKLGIIAGCALLAIWLAGQANKHIVKGITSLHIGLQNFKDGEFSTSLSISGDDELQHLCQLYNETADKLRQEKQWLHQRELMLDKVLHTSPDVLVLVNDRQQVIFSNYQARQFFNKTQKLEGFTVEQLLCGMPESLNDTMLGNKEGLFTLPYISGERQTWHMATGSLLLNNQRHYLYIFKQMTRELNRQEVMVWKKVIRIISHELNNSLGPISSMLHSGQLLSQKQDDERLERVFKTIEERIDHLNQFVQGYGKFAKLPSPTVTDIDVSKLIEQLKQQYYFKPEIGDNVLLSGDEMQIEQMLINLLKNSHESGSAPNDIELSIVSEPAGVVIKLQDQGKGMTDSVMTNALIPFYSTKTNGSGLGLALCREIVEAHHGNITVYNRKPNGLCVTVLLPCTVAKEGD